MSNISICSVNTPFGHMTLKASHGVLTESLFAKSTHEIIHPDDTQVLDLAKTQLNEFFEGIRKEFELPIKLSGTQFQQTVLREVEKIRFGQTISYGQIAENLGDKNTVRAVGTANGNNKLLVIVPCHRVVGSDGKLVGYAGGIDIKRALLQFESDIVNRQTKLFS